MHAGKLKEVYGEFNYAPYKTPFDPELEVEQLKIFLPKYKPNTPIKTSSKTKTSTPNGKPASSDNATSSSQKKRARSRSRHRKSTSEDKDMEGYGTDDDFETSLNNEKRKQLLKTFENEEKVQKEDESDKEKTNDNLLVVKEVKDDSGKIEDDSKSGRFLNNLHISSRFF